jgi:hypothetical protein
MSEQRICVRYVGGPWDGLEVCRSSVAQSLGTSVQFPYQERLAAYHAGEPLPDNPQRSRHMSIYRYDDHLLDGGVVYCRFEQAFTREDWRQRCERRWRGVRQHD